MDHIFTDVDGTHQDAATLKQISDDQAAAMHDLGSTLEMAGAAITGRAGTTLQQVGADMHTTGMMFSQQFDDHSNLMHNNAVQLSSKDDDNANHILAAVNSLSS
jgi:hypothetical protein